VASTVYVVERPIRRIVSHRQFSLKGFLLTVASIALVVSCAVDQYRSWYRFLERYPGVDAFPPALVFAPLPVRLPLLFGASCLAYVILEAAWWGVCTAKRFMTSDWERGDRPDDG